MLNKVIKFTLLASAVVMLSACGGGGGGSTSNETSTTEDTILEKNEYVISIPESTANINPEDLKVQTFLEEDNVVAEDTSGVVMAEDDEGNTIMLGYHLPNSTILSSSSLLRNASNKIELSIRSTAYALVMMIAASGMDEEEKNSLGAIVLEHKDFDTLVAEMTTTYQGNYLYLESLKNYSSLVNMINNIAEDVSSQFQNTLNSPKLRASQWDNWIWYDQGDSLSSPPFLATASNGSRIALANPSYTNYIASIYDCNDNKLNWFIAPRNSTIIQKYLNDDAAMRELAIGSDITSDGQHVVYTIPLSMYGLNSLHVLTGIVNVFADGTVFKIILDRAVDDLNFYADLSTCFLNLGNTMDFSTSSEKTFIKNLLSSNTRSIVESTLTSCIKPIASNMLSSTLKDKLDDIAIKLLAKIGVKASNPIGWAWIVFEAGNELIPVTSSLLLAHNHDEQGYQIDWNDNTVESIIANDSSPSCVQSSSSSSIQSSSSSSSSVIASSSSSSSLSSQVSSSSSTAQSSSSVAITPSNGLVAHYEFEGNAVDSSGNGNNGTEYGGVSYTSGVIGQAASFDGVNDYMQMSKNYPFYDEFTISGWFKFSDQTRLGSEVWDSLFAFGDSYCDTLQFMYHHTNKYFTLYNDGGCSGIKTTDYSITYNKFLHIVLTYDGATFRILVNNIEIESFAYNSLILDASKLILSLNNRSSTYHFGGAMDDLRIYNRALSESEIQDLYQMGGVTSDSSYGTITSSVTGRVWLDRNLGASQACTSKTDSSCYGDYYQWGRDADGHEKVNSGTTSTKSSSITPSHGNFISGIVQPYDWTTADVDGLGREASWNPCPTGYRVPTTNEIEAESLSNNSDAFEKLLFPSAGYRGYEGSMHSQGDYGLLWTSDPVDVDYANYLRYFDDDAYIRYTGRIGGLNVRCIQQ